MKWNNRVVILIALLVIVLILIVVGTYFLKEFRNHAQLIFVNFPPTPILDSTANARFFERSPLDSSYEINQGLTITRTSIGGVKGIPTPSANYVSLLILNHTEEPIVFDDVGFGIQVFQYESPSSEWRQVNLPYVPEKKQKVLPPKTEKFDFTVLNGWEFNDSDFINLSTNVVRIIIRGIGADSSKNYGAYIDLLLQK